jgi:hypothetical protein
VIGGLVSIVRMAGIGVVRWFPTSRAERRVRGHFCLPRRENILAGKLWRYPRGGSQFREKRDGIGANLGRKMAGTIIAPCDAHEPVGLCCAEGDMLKGGCEPSKVAPAPVGATSCVAGGALVLAKPAGKLNQSLPRHRHGVEARAAPGRGGPVVSG